MPSKVEVGRRLRWVLPLRPYPFFRRLAPWRFNSLGCWTAKIAVTLDTRKEYRSTNLFQMVRKYCEDVCRDCAHYFAIDRSNREHPSAAISVGGCSVAEAAGEMLSPDARPRLSSRCTGRRDRR